MCRASRPAVGALQLHLSTNCRINNKRRRGTAILLPSFGVATDFVSDAISATSCFGVHSQPIRLSAYLHKMGSQVWGRVKHANGNDCIRPGVSRTMRWYTQVSYVFRICFILASTLMHIMLQTVTQSIPWIGLESHGEESLQ